MANKEAQAAQALSRMLEEKRQIAIAERIAGYRRIIGVGVVGTDSVVAASILELRDELSDMKEQLVDMMDVLRSVTGEISTAISAKKKVVSPVKKKKQPRHDGRGRG